MNDARRLPSVALPVIVAAAFTLLFGCTGPALSGGDDDNDDAADDDDTGDDDTGPDDLLCPEVLDDAILGCVADLQGDPGAIDGLYLLDLLLLCADAEPMAGAYDAYCATASDDPICALAYESFVFDVLPQCTERARNVLFAGNCLLPEEYRDLANTHGVVRMQRRFVTDATELNAIEAEQVLATSAAIGWVVPTVEEAILATDDDGFEQFSILAIGTDRRIELFSAHYGDTRVGRLWFTDTLVQAGALSDSFLTNCAVEPGIEGQPCAGPGDPACGTDNTCRGYVVDAGGTVVIGGVCISTEGVPGQGDLCAADNDCALGAICSPYGAGSPDGQCVPGWMRRSFRGAQDFPSLVAGGITRIPLTVSGLASVPTVAHIDLVLGQGANNGLTLSLENPFFTTVPVFDTSGSPTVDIDLDWHEVPVPGDEPVNGEWALLIEDAGGSASGAVWDLVVTFDSRYD